MHSWLTEGVLSIGKAALEQSIAKHILRYESDRSALYLSGKVVEHAANLALQRVDGLKSAQATVSSSSCALEFVMDSGHTATLEIEPIHLNVSCDKVVVRLAVPSGIQVGHESSHKGILVRFADAILGISENKVNEIPGVTYDGSSIEYERNLDDFALMNSLRPYLTDQAVLVPISIKDSWLEFDLSRVLPSGTSIDWTDILSKIPFTKLI